MNLCASSHWTFSCPVGKSKCADLLLQGQLSSPHGRKVHTRLWQKGGGGMLRGMPWPQAEPRDLHHCWSPGVSPGALSWLFSSAHSVLYHTAGHYYLPHSVPDSSFSHNQLLFALPWEPWCAAFTKQSPKDLNLLNSFPTAIALPEGSFTYMQQSVGEEADHAATCDIKPHRMHANPCQSS